MKQYTCQKLWENIGHASLSAVHTLANSIHTLHGKKETHHI